MAKKKNTCKPMPKSCPLVDHSDMKKITRPAFITANYSALISLIVTLFTFTLIFITENISLDKVSEPIAGIWIFISFLISVLTFFGAYLLRQEHHNLAGSIIILAVNAIGMAVVAGLFIGPLLGIIAGMLGINEHEKLIKHHI